MLYVTTRSDRDAFTAHRALHENRGGDGGLYLPFRTPNFSGEALDALLDRSFHGCVAEILNQLFGTKLTAWEVEFAIGREPTALKNLGRRIAVAELWRNPDWQYARLVRDLSNLLREDEGEPGGWPRIAIGSAVLFGLYSQLKQFGANQPVDVCLAAGDFSMAMSAWYARQWGLPIGNIVCCCNENNGLWDLLCHGQMRTDALSVPTAIPEADVALPVDLERLIYHCGGTAEVAKYLEVCRRGRVYSPSELMLRKLREGLYISVVGSQRLGPTISNLYRTNAYVLSPYTALCYGGLLDYRAKTGETRPCLILAEKSPRRDLEAVAQATGLTPEALKKRI